MIAIFFLGTLVLLAVLWWLLNRHENRRAAAGLPRHSGFRLLLASVAVLAALFSGGCSLLFAANMDGSYATPAAIAVIGGLPFLAAASWGVVALARRRSGVTIVLLLLAVFITSFGVVAFAALTGLSPAMDPTLPGLAISALATGACAIWLFLTRKPDNPKGP